MSDLFRKYKSLYSSTSNTFSTGEDVTITPASVVGLPAGTEITLTFDRVDSSGTKTPDKMERIRGTVTGSNFVVSSGGRAVEGTEQVHTSPVVEMVWNADDLNDILDGILVEHNQDGTHKAQDSLAILGTAVDTDTSLTANSDSKVATQKAVKAYVDANASASPLTTKGDLYSYGTDDARLPVGSDGQTLVVSNSEALGMKWIDPLNSLFRQTLINGNFDVWQRGTSIAMTTANAYSADRWYCETATAGTDKTISRQDGTGVNGSYYCARVLFASDVDELLTFSQALESQDSIKFRGKKITLSFYARGGAEFVADNATLVSKIVTGKGTDQKVSAFTTSADGVSQNNTLTTDWQKFTCTTTAAIASDITQIGVSFAFTHAGSGTTTNYFEIAQVQLCAGEVALPFMPKSFDEELNRCLRYYEKSFPYGTAPSDSTGGWMLSGYAGGAGGLLTHIEFKVKKRSVPTITTYGNSGKWEYYSSGWLVADSMSTSALLTESEVSILAAKTGLTEKPYLVRGFWAAEAEL